MVNRGLSHKPGQGWSGFFMRWRYCPIFFSVFYPIFSPFRTRRPSRFPLLAADMNGSVELNAIEMDRARE